MVKEQKIKTVEEIKKEIKEPKYDYIEKLATISDDTKSLILRIPQDIRKHFNIKAGDKIRFYAKFEEKRAPKLEIKVIKNVG